MQENGVSSEFESYIVQLIKAIHHAQRFPHFLIIMSVRGFRSTTQAETLKRFLEQNGTKKFRMKSSDEY